MLAACGLPELPRRWTVRIGLTFICEVTAGTEHAAFDTAEDAIAAAVTDAACPIDVDWVLRDAENHHGRGVYDAGRRSRRTGRPDR